MTIQSANIQITGIAPLLMNNPQTVNRFNKYFKAMAKINAKKTRKTDDDFMELQELEIRSKVYFDEQLGIWIPSNWILSAIAANGYRVAKTSKADIRGAVFPTELKLPLQYDRKDLVKTPEDIVFNTFFRHIMILKQGNVRIVKAFPIFHNWSFKTQLEFDDKIIDPDSLKSIIEHASKYGGFGDFRPTFGRATAEVTFDV